MCRILLFFVTMFFFNFVYFAGSGLCDINNGIEQNKTVGRLTVDNNSLSVEGYIENNFNRYDKRFDQYDKEVDRIYTIIGYSFTATAVFIAFISWIGFKTISKWIKGIVVEKLTCEYAIQEKKLTEKFEKIIYEFEEKAKLKLKDIETTRTEYDSILEQLNNSRVGENSISSFDGEKLSKFVDDLNIIKAVEEYTAEDWCYKGLAEIDRKNYEKAIEILSKSIQVEESNVAYANLSYCYLNLKKYNEALEFADKAISLDREDNYSYDTKGLIFSELKQYDKALEFYEKSFSINKKIILTRLCLAELYLINGYYDKCLEIIDFNTKKYSVIRTFIKILAMKIKNIDSSNEEEYFDKLFFGKRFNFEWSFCEIESLNNNPELSEDLKDYIRSKIYLIKKHGCA